MAYPHLLTYADCIQHAIGFVGGNATAAGHADILRAVQNAYRELTEARRWTYLLKLDRIRVQEPYSTGTIEYDHTGGSSELLVTLTGGTWPTWAAYGSLEIAGKIHRVSSRLGSSTLTLDANRNPGADIASSTTYTLFREVYSLPTDFIALDIPYGSDRWRLGRFVPTERMALTTTVRGEGSGSPAAFTVMGDPDNAGRMAIHTLYVPTATEELDLIYIRRPRQLVQTGYLSMHKAGTAAISASGSTVTGTSSAFTSALVGSYIRFSANSTYPTGPDGSNPAVEQLKISAYSSATSLTTASASGTTLSGVAYRISDPVDIAPSMHTAMFRGIEKQIALARNYRNRDEFVSAYQQALSEAAGLDGSDVYHPQQVGDGPRHGVKQSTDQSPEAPR